MLIDSKRKREPSGIVELLLECHERIRSFVALAKRLGEVEKPTDDEIRDAARSVRRYFAEALPLHVQDEEHSVLPRLRGRDALVDGALDKMQTEHLAHRQLLESIVSTCRALEASPDRHAMLRQALADTASDMEREFGVHLQQEEETILPAIDRWISAEEQENMVVELRQRRS